MSTVFKNKKLHWTLTVSALFCSDKSWANSAVDDPKDIQVIGQSNSDPTYALRLTNAEPAVAYIGGPAPDISSVSISPAEAGINTLTKKKHSLKSYSLDTYMAQSKSVNLEILALTTAITATRFKDFTARGSRFQYRREGWFGRDTKSLGMDKLHHGWKTYVFTDVLQRIIAKRTGDKRSSALTGAVLGFGVMSYAEFLDGYTDKSGFSKEDMAVHFAGAGVSLLRNAVPGLEKKFDFRMEIKPQSLVRDLKLDEQLSERKYLLVGKLAGINRFKDSPMRFVEMQLGYYARGFAERERLINAPLQRKIFFGVGLNVQQFFSSKSRNRLERLVRGSLDYVQVPYFSLRN